MKITTKTGGVFDLKAVREAWGMGAEAGPVIHALIDALEAVLAIRRHSEVQGDTAFAVIVNARADGYNLALEAVHAAAKAHE